MDHVLKHVSLSGCGICYFTGCTKFIVHHCRDFHKREGLHVPAAYLGRFIVHPNLLETFIAFSQFGGMTDAQEVTVRKAFTNKNSHDSSLTSGADELGCPLNSQLYHICSKIRPVSFLMFLFVSLFDVSWLV